MGEVLVRAGMRTISLGIAALALGFAFKSGGTYAVASADVGLHAERISVFGTIHPDIFRLRTPVGVQLSDNPPVRAASNPPVRAASRGVRVASLGTDDASWAALEDATGSFAPSPTERRASFDERFGQFDTRLASFDDRFGSPAAEPRNRVLRRPDPPAKNAARAPMGQPKPAPVAQAPRSAAAKNHFRPAESKKDAPEANTEPTSTPEDDTRTAIYDITAKTVYLPDGRRLEAHSGLGSHMDDPRYIHVRMHGATPPNVYNLSLRENLFHGVRALRLTPAGSGKMYGRAGILAHSYMLGPNGQSNGCVSFSDYPEFLNAYLKGEVNRLVVVEHLDAVPTPKTQVASASWLPDAVRKFFRPADGTGQYAAAQ